LAFGRFTARFGAADLFGLETTFFRGFAVVFRAFLEARLRGAFFAIRGLHSRGAWDLDRPLTERP
jgi:hypothetical protein